MLVHHVVKYGHSTKNCFTCRIFKVMKITVGELRWLIREVVDGPEDRGSQDSLLDVLFPSSAKRNTVRAVWVAVGLNRFRSGVNLDLFAQRFVDAYHDELVEITDGGRVKYLGGGMVGDAYEFTGGAMVGKILKIEPGWATIGSGAPHETMQDRIWGSGERAASHPMVYDQGVIPLDKVELKVPGKSIKWAILERLEVLHGDAAAFVSLFIERGCIAAENAADAFAWGIDGYDPDPTGEKLSARTSEALEIAQRMRLNPRLVAVKRSGSGGDVDVPQWCIDLFRAVKDALSDPGIKPDLKGENVGLRRLGGTKVEWVFFD